MKKNLLVALFVVCAATFAHAQFFVGTSLGFDITSTKLNGNKVSSGVGFSISPELGYSLTDRLDLGLAFGFSTETDKTITLPNDIKNIENSWNIAPFVRYSVCQFGRFEILGRGDLFIAGSKDKTKTGNTEVTTSNVFTFGLNIAPVLAYNLSEHFVLQAELNFLGIGFSTSKNKETERAVTDFGLLIDSNNMLNMGDLNIGFIYRF